MLVINELSIFVNCLNISLLTLFAWPKEISKKKISANMLVVKMDMGYVIIFREFS